MATYNELRNINVNAHTEKKGQLTYLSWAWAVDTLLQHDSGATWEFPEPKYFGDTVMVFCNVTAFGKTMKMQLPVMDNRNNAISNPDARKISDATMRCLAKCIACFGIGLYIYSGSDLPEDDEPAKPEPLNVDKALAAIRSAKDMATLKRYHTEAVKRATGDDVFALDAAYEVAKEVLEASK